LSIAYKTELEIYDHLPEGFLDANAQELYQILSGPSLIHLQGENDQPVFVSILQHGNEDVGLRAVQMLLKRYQDKLPRSISIFVGNVAAARYGARRLDGQPDYNRVWPGAEDFIDSAEYKVMQEVTMIMRDKRPFVSIDLHNNTGLNPHYACINVLDDRFFYLASLFSRTVVYFLRPVGVQSLAFAEICPSVTVECGRTGDQRGIEHAAEYLDACLHLAGFPEHSMPRQDIDLYHTVAITKVPENISFGFGSAKTDICFIDDLDHYNFREVFPGMTIAHTSRDLDDFFQVIDEAGVDVTEDYFVLEDNEIRFKQNVMPSMLTLDEKVIRQDCLCYLMERYPL